SSVRGRSSPDCLAKPVCLPKGRDKLASQPQRISKKASGIARSVSRQGLDRFDVEQALAGFKVENGDPGSGGSVVMDGQSVAGKRDGYDLRALWDFERQRALWRRDDRGYDLRFPLFAGPRSKAEDAHHDGAEADDYE